MFSVGGFEGRLQKLGHGKPVGLGSVKVTVGRASIRSYSDNGAEGIGASDVPYTGTHKTEKHDGTPETEQIAAEAAEHRRMLVSCFAEPLWCWDVDGNGEVSRHEADDGEGNLGAAVSYPKPKPGPIGDNNRTYSWFKNNRGRVNSESFRQMLFVPASRTSVYRT